MRVFVFVLVAVSSAALSSQTPAQTPSGPDQLFHFSPPLSSRSPHFKIQMDGSSPRVFCPNIVIVNPPAPDVHVDPGIVRHPPEGSFAVTPSTPVLPQNLHPGLKIQPTELASLAPLTTPLPDGQGISIPIMWPNAKMIPITWPDAKVILIPRNVDGFKAVEIRSQAPASPPTNDPNG